MSGLFTVEIYDGDIKRLFRDAYLAGASATNLKKLTGRLAKSIEISGRIFAPKKTHDLEKGIKVKPSRVSITVISGGVPYAGVVHYGRTGTGGSEYLSRARDAHLPRIYQEINQKIDHILTRHQL